jgi:hypothetical protein
MSDTNDSQIIEPIPIANSLPNHIPYVLQHLKELYDRIQTGEPYITIPSKDNISSQEEDVDTFKLAFQQAIHTLVQHTEFVHARQDEWVHKFERMRDIASQWSQPHYYMDLIQTAEHAFMDVLEWTRTCEDDSSHHSRTYAMLFNID